ncbi:MAG: hypothetical protein HQL08_01440 [Nitrospirae bacterium]|nr:hypothetical protein [Nitrospirota bacterium]
MNKSQLVTMFLEEGTAKEAIERALKKQAEIDARKADREAIEDNMKKSEQAKETERIEMFVHSSIYDALMNHKHMKKGDTISVLHRTSRVSGSLAVITADSKQELIPYLEKSHLQDFRIKDELMEEDQSKDWVKVDDRIAGKQYYIVSRL